MIPFTKMHGAGNDFVFFDAIHQVLPENLSVFSKVLCDRRFGIGADQILVVQKSKNADFKMLIYNADGGEVEMCGNGIRCFAKFVRDKKLTDKTEMTIETLGGVITPKILPDHPRASASMTWVRVDMGTPILEAEKIPTRGQGQLVAQVFPWPEEILKKYSWLKDLHFTAVSMGNPHAIFFVEDLENFPVEELGRIVESHPFFPKRTNVEFVKILDSGHVQQRTWERGSGETHACGTGASAVCVAGVLARGLDRHLTISLRGGDLEIHWDEKTDHVFKTGPAMTVFEGQWEEAV